eukprot:7384351-Prymnesium_polylepis.1
MAYAGASREAPIVSTRALMHSSAKILSRVALKELAATCSAVGARSASASPGSSLFGPVTSFSLAETVAIDRVSGCSQRCPAYRPFPVTYSQQLSTREHLERFFILTHMER